MDFAVHQFLFYPSLNPTTCRLIASTESFFYIMIISFEIKFDGVSPLKNVNTKIAQENFDLEVCTNRLLFALFRGNNNF